jgi:hypothetical protein
MASPGGFAAFLRPRNVSDGQPSALAIALLALRQALAELTARQGPPAATVAARPASSPMASVRPPIRCREIQAADIEGVIGVLERSFPHRDPSHWVRVFKRLAGHRGVPDLPRYGYLLEADGQPVGALLVIFSTTTAGSQTLVRGTLSAWCADLPYRAYAPALAARVLARGDVTFLNITPAPHTWPILVAQGFHPFAANQFAAVPFFCRGPRDARVGRVTEDLLPGPDLAQAECELLADHLRFGCISVTCTWDGQRHPFVFARRWKYGCLPYAQLIYCRSVDDFVRFAGALGRHLARRGLFLVFLDAAEHLRGVPGRLSRTWPKFFKGTQAPRLGDLSYTDRAMFGF